MTKAETPYVLIIDDEDMSSFAALIEEYDVTAMAVSPDEVDIDRLSRATVVIVDQYIDNWPGRPVEPLASVVPDGLSMAAVLRSHIERTYSREAPSPHTTAIAIRTGEFDLLGAHLPRAARAHLLAAQHDLEWVFDKKEQPLPEQQSPPAKIAALAQAASKLPGDWSGSSRGIESAWLDLPSGSSWEEEAWWQIEQCRPPRHVVATSTAGRAWLRWFLQKILPYPTFLVDDKRAALVLGMTTTSFISVVASESQLAERLKEAEYTGGCNRFEGRRWWRAALVALLTELAGIGDELDDDQLGHADEIRAALEDLHGQPLEFFALERAVLRVNANYEVIDEPIDAEDGVRLQPDDWPPYADEPWATRSDLAADDDLRGLVVELDRRQLPASQAGGNVGT